MHSITCTLCMFLPHIQEVVKKYYARENPQERTVLRRLPFEAPTRHARVLAFAISSSAKNSKTHNAQATDRKDCKPATHMQKDQDTSAFGLHVTGTPTKSARPDTPHQLRPSSSPLHPLPSDPSAPPSSPLPLPSPPLFPALFLPYVCAANGEVAGVTVGFFACGLLTAFALTANEALTAALGSKTLNPKPLNPKTQNPQTP